MNPELFFMRFLLIVNFYVAANDIMATTFNDDSLFKVTDQKGNISFTSQASRINYNGTKSVLYQALTPPLMTVTFLHTLRLITEIDKTRIVTKKTMENDDDDDDDDDGKGDVDGGKGEG